MRKYLLVPPPLQNKFLLTRQTLAMMFEFHCYALALRCLVEFTKTTVGLSIRSTDRSAGDVGVRGTFLKTRVRLL